MRNSHISNVALKIANKLSLHHHKRIAYKFLYQNDFMMLMGFCVEPNRFQSNTFSIRYFIQPLYLKFDYIDLSLGDIVGEWEYSEVDTSLDVIYQVYNNTLSRLNSIIDVITAILNCQIRFYGSPYARNEFFAYSYLAINEYAQAIPFLTSLTALNEDDNKEWYSTIISSASQICKLLQRNNYAEVRDIMLLWQSYTLNKLGV